MTAGSPWPDTQVAELCRLLGEGLTRSEIAKQLGCTLSSIDGKVTKLRRASDSRLPDRARIADATKNRAASTIDRRDSVAPLITDAPSPIKRRDPCFKCGVRRDIGCIHTAWEKAA